MTAAQTRDSPPTAFQASLISAFHSSPWKQHLSSLGVCRNRNGWPRRRRVRAGSRVSWINTSSGGVGMGLAWTSVRITLGQRVLSAYCMVAPWHTATPWAAEGQAGGAQAPVHANAGSQACAPLLLRLCLAWWRFLPQDSKRCLLIRARPASARVPGCFCSAENSRSPPRVVWEGGRTHWEQQGSRWLLLSPPGRPLPARKPGPGGHLGGASRGPCLPGRDQARLMPRLGVPLLSGLRQPAGWLGRGPTALTVASPRVQVFAAKVLNLVLPNMSLGRIDSSVLSRNKTEVSLSEELGATGAGGGSWPRPRHGGSPGVGLAAAVCSRSPEAPCQAPSGCRVWWERRQWFSKLCPRVWGA